MVWRSTLSLHPPKRTSQVPLRPLQWPHRGPLYQRDDFRLPLGMDYLSRQSGQQVGPPGWLGHALRAIGQNVLPALAYRNPRRQMIRWMPS
jgi:hypothetical protein